MSIKYIDEIVWIEYHTNAKHGNGKKQLHIISLGDEYTWIEESD